MSGTVRARADLFAGPGEMRRLCREKDWASTPLGAVSDWSISLRTTVATLLASRHPMFLFWGPDLVQIYNDAYRPSLAGGGRHPRALGMRGHDFWTEIWDIIGPQIEKVMGGGDATWHVDQLVPIERNARIEEVYWTYSYSPVLDDDGGVGGTLVVCQETTDRVLAERRLRTLHAMDRIEEHAGIEATAAEATSVLAANVLDVPFAICFLDAERRAPVSASAPTPHAGDDAGAPSSEPGAPDFAPLLRLVHAERIRPGSPWLDPESWPLESAFRSQRPERVQVRAAEELTGDMPWPEWPVSAAVVPIEAPGGTPRHGALVVGLSARLPWDPRYEAFVRAATNQVGAQVAAKQADAERERLHQALDLERARLEYIFRQAPSFLAVLRGPQHVFELVNDAYYQLVGHRDLIGKPAFEALPEVRNQGFEELLDGVLETGEPFIGRELPLQVQRTPDGPSELRFIDLTYKPFVEPDGTRSGIIAHGLDVTEQVLARKEVERLLNETERLLEEAEVARAAAEQANRAKAQFLANMSHELRTPLNAIGGYAELIEIGVHGPITETQAAALQRIQASQRHLLGLINQILNYTRLDADAVPYDLEPVGVAAALTAGEALVTPQAQTKGLNLLVDPVDPGLTVIADHAKLQQILLNLLSNAVKYTDPGGMIRLRASARDDSVAIEVSDTGRGVPASKLKAIFDPFVQVDALLTGAEQGVGLGLAISRELARGMGGDLIAESEVDAGSTFTLFLPAVTSASSHAPRPGE